MAWKMKQKQMERCSDRDGACKATASPCASLSKAPVFPAARLRRGTNTRTYTQGTRVCSVHEDGTVPADWRDPGAATSRAKANTGTGGGAEAGPTLPRTLPVPVFAVQSRSLCAHGGLFRITMAVCRPIALGYVQSSPRYEGSPGLVSCQGEDGGWRVAGSRYMFTMSYILARRSYANKEH